MGHGSSTEIARFDPSVFAWKVHDALESDDLAQALAEANRPRTRLTIVVPDARTGEFTRHDGRDSLGVPDPHQKFLRSLFAAPAPVWTAIEGNRCLAAGDAPIRAAAALFFRDEPYGLALLHDDASSVDLVPWEPVLRALAAQVVKVQLYESACREASTAGMKVEALNEVGALVRYVDLDVLLTKLMELSVRIAGAEVGAIVLVEGDRLITGVEWGLTEDVLGRLRTRDGEPLLEAVLASGAPVRVQDASNTEWIDPATVGVALESLLVIPLVCQATTLGLVIVANARESGFDSDGSEILSTIANLAAAAIQNAVLYQSAMEHERISAEMTLASNVQSSMLPSVAPRRPGVEIAGWNIPCDETGGDYYDFVDMGDGRTGIVIGDATGHGMGAALMMFIVRSTLRALLTRGGDLVSIVQTMNDLVEEASESNRFMTLFFGVVDESGRTLTYTNAGHDPPIVYRASTGEFLELPGTGVPLGVLRGSIYRVATVALNPGDFWVFGTDGIWEARNEAGEFFGKPRFQRLARELSEMPIDAASQRLRDEVLSFHGSAERRDDITAVLMRVAR